MREYHKRLTISAFPDGSTYIVWITEKDENGNAIGEQQEIEGVVADSEEDAINRVAAQIMKRTRAQFPGADIKASPVSRE